MKKQWRYTVGTLKNLLWNFSVCSLQLPGKFSVTIVSSWYSIAVFKAFERQLSDIRAMN
jgi:hypothetical protein